MTAPIILPNYGEQIGESFARIGKSLGEIIHPHAGEQDAFRRAVAANPKLLQNIRDLVVEQPPEEIFAAIKRFVPQDLIDVITNMNPSPEATIKAAGRRAITQASPEGLAALGLGSVMGMAPTAAARELAVAPKIGEAAGLTPEQVGPTAAERGAYADVAGQPPEEAGVGLLKGKAVQAAGEFWNSLSPENKAKLGAYSSLPAIMADDHFTQQLALQREIFEARKGDRVSELMLRLKEQNIIWWQQNTGVGTTEGWREFFSPDGSKRLDKLKSGAVTDITNEDQQLLDIDRAFKAAPAEKRALDLNRTDAGVTKLITAIGKTTDESVRAGLISALNQQFINRARLTDSPPIHAAWAPSKMARDVKKKPESMGGYLLGQALGHFKKLRFYDDQNNEVSADLIEAIGTVGSAVSNATRPPAAPSAPGSPGGTAPSGSKSREQRWNELRAQMFPSVQAGQLSPAQIQAVTSRVNAEFAQ